jgi:hypothetical protein
VRALQGRMVTLAKGRRWALGQPWPSVPALLGHASSQGAPTSVGAAAFSMHDATFPPRYREDVTCG